ncbi:MAG: DUF3082 domain-containing protein [Synechococcales cyanobacterium RM1_1_8]|nr:DUF3082 domain-containing protein [Synechococcales cyanobacterium RM1_1_8]
MDEPSKPGSERPGSEHPEAEQNPGERAALAPDGATDGATDGTVVPQASSQAQDQPKTVLQCWSGAAIATAFGYGAYSLTTKIATNFAAHPFTSSNFIAVRISTAVRTLVVGMFTLATTIFAFAALGLLALGIQTALQKLRPEAPPGA